MSWSSLSKAPLSSPVGWMDLAVKKWRATKTLQGNEGAKRLIACICKGFWVQWYSDWKASFSIVLKWFICKHLNDSSVNSVYPASKAVSHLILEAFWALIKHWNKFMCESDVLKVQFLLVSSEASIRCEYLLCWKKKIYLKTAQLNAKKSQG